jgi:hypothetical protein
MHQFPGSEQKIIFRNSIPGKQRNLGVPNRSTRRGFFEPEGPTQEAKIALSFRVSGGNATV